MKILLAVLVILGGLVIAGVGQVSKYDPEGRSGALRTMIPIGLGIAFGGFLLLVWSIGKALLS